MKQTGISIPFIAGVFLISLALAINNPSTTLASIKVGVLDVEQLMEETGFADQEMVKIQKKYAAEEKAIEKQEHVLENEVKKYNKISDNLSPPEVKQWQHKINKLQLDLQRRQNILQEKIMAAEEQATQKVISYFFTIVSKLAQKNNLDLVLFKDVTSCSNMGIELLDITDKVIQLSDQKSNA